MRNKPWNVFYAGEHTDWRGRKFMFSEDDLESIKESLPGKPIQVEHSGSFVQGRVKEAHKVGQDLFIIPEGLPVGFEERYKGRGVSLQLVPPDHPDNPTPGKWFAEHVAVVDRPALKELLPAFGDDGRACFTAVFDDKDEEVSKIREHIKRLEKELRKKDFEGWWSRVAFTEKGFRVPPSEKEGLYAFWEFLATGDKVAFGGDGVNVLDWFKSFIERLPVHAAFTEVAGGAEETKPKASGRGVVIPPGWTANNEKLELLDKIKEYMSNHGVSFRDACRVLGI